jgi:hypothetical protein
MLLKLPGIGRLTWRKRGLAFGFVTMSVDSMDLMYEQFTDW